MSATSDRQAQTVLAELAKALPGWGGRDGADPRGLARELVIVTLALQHLERGEAATHLARAVRLYEAEGRRTLSALKKCASHARALLRYGRVEGTAVTSLSAGLELQGPALYRALDSLVLRINKAEALGARIETLSRTRRTRGAPGAGLRVLSAVLDLRTRAEAGEGGAATELNLIRSLLAPSGIGLRYAAE
jgi:hypothetical protein